MLETQSMSAEIPNLKPGIVDLLKMLASEERQLTYERNVPHVDITVELLCMWFDDLYHPGDAFFRSCFSPDELATLAEFNTYYHERISQLPESQGMVRTWLASSAWREIMRKAHETALRMTS